MAPKGAPGGRGWKRANLKGRGGLGVAPEMGSSGGRAEGAGAGGDAPEGALGAAEPKGGRGDLDATPGVAGRGGAQPGGGGHGSFGWEMRKRREERRERGRRK